MGMPKQERSPVISVTPLVDPLKSIESRYKWVNGLRNELNYFLSFRLSKTNLQKQAFSFKLWF